MTTFEPTSRNPGRPRHQDDVTQDGLHDRLLNTAVTLLTRDDVSSTTPAAIAHEAGVTAPMAHYRFKPRDQLFGAVVEGCIRPLVDQVARSALATVADGTYLPDLAQTLTDVAQHMMTVATATPWSPTLWTREVTSEGGQLRERVFMCIALGRVTLLVDRITRA